MAKQRAREGGAAAVLATAAVAACGVALWCVPRAQTELAFTNARGERVRAPAGTPALPFKPTKFGPLRRAKWTASRYRVLALWAAASRSTESCMDATNEIYPDARDDSCVDIDRSMALVQQCMRNQKDGFQRMADGKNGAWDALPALVDMTHALGTSDRDMVATKLDKSAVFFTLARLEALHAECHGLGPAKDHLARTGQLTSPNGMEDAVARVGNAIQYMRRVSARARWAPHEVMPAGPAGEWVQDAKVTYEEPESGRLAFEGQNDPLRRAARRGYLPGPDFYPSRRWAAAGAASAGMWPAPWPLRRQQDLDAHRFQTPFGGAADGVPWGQLPWRRSRRQELGGER